MVEDPKFKVGDVILDNKSRDIATIIAVDQRSGQYTVECTDVGLGIYNKGFDYWGIDGVDERSSLYEAGIIDLVLNKYLNI